MEVVIGSDHGGKDLKDALARWMESRGVAFEDVGTDSTESVDYPDFAEKVVRTVLDGTARLGVLVCGTGIGMSIAANRHRGIRAALCTSSYMARMARAHNDANVLCLGGRVIGPGEAADVLQAFLEGEFEGGRHVRRLGKIDPAK
ncbi:MAG: ribose 5-phosphate isomerase B [Deltaproteobacteria bacterium]|nr:MAG: ribose 5-phosphate isomerase B [Deltaproteobacteria bacterium]